MVDERPQRPDGASHPRTYLNVRHDRLVVSWEFDRKGVLHRRLFIRPLSRQTYEPVSTPEPSVNFPSELVDPGGDWLYAVRSVDESDETMRFELVRWSVATATNETFETVASHDSDFGYDRYRTLWPTQLLAVSEPGTIVGIFAGVPATSETETEFHLGELTVAAGNLTLTHRVAGPSY